MKNKKTYMLIIATVLAVMVILWSSCSELSRFVSGENNAQMTSDSDSKNLLESQNSKNSDDAEDKSNSNNSTSNEDASSNAGDSKDSGDSKSSDGSNDSVVAVPSSFYISAKVGGAISSFDEFDQTDDDYWRMQASFAWGVYLTDTVRTELELGYLSKITDKESSSFGTIFETYKAEQKITTAQINVYFQLSKNESFAPYIGFGAGVAHINTQVMENLIQEDVLVNNSKIKDSQNAFIANATIGATTKITQRINIDYEARYSFVKAEGDDINNLSATIGIRYRF